MFKVERAVTASSYDIITRDTASVLVDALIVGTHHRRSHLH